MALENKTCPVERHDDGNDDYVASIDFSNACREFYRSRVKATETFKQSMSGNSAVCNTGMGKNSIDNAMGKLRTEMASLMEQDLSLMKQLLNLNEAIEELKFKRLYYVSKDEDDDWSCSETDMYESEADVSDAFLDARLSRGKLARSNSSVKRVGQNSTNSLNNRITSSQASIQSSQKICHGPQSSIDSGYGEGDERIQHEDGQIEIII